MIQPLFALNAPLVRPRVQLALLLLVVILASVHRIWLVDGAFNNFLIFRASFTNLQQGVDLYAPHPEQYFDLYKYSPSFAAFMAPFHLVPVGIGAVLWNLLNAVVPFLALRRLRISEPWKAFVFLFILIELITSVQNAQSNGLMTGLMLLAFTAFERKQVVLAALFLVLGFYIKLFAAVGGLLFVFYDRRLRFLLAGAGWVLLFAALPLLFTTPELLQQQYESWLHLLGNDPAHLLNFSVMTVAERWLGWRASDVWYLVPGALLLLLPLLRRHHWRNENFRLLYMAALLVWSVIFNHKAESPTYVIAMMGIALWATTEPRSRWRTFLLVLAVVGIELLPTDLFPASWKQQFFVPYAIKAVPAIVIWVWMMVRLLRGKYFAEQRLFR